MGGGASRGGRRTWKAGERGDRCIERPAGKRRYAATWPSPAFFFLRPLCSLTRSSSASLRLRFYFSHLPTFAPNVVAQLLVRLLPYLVRTGG